jgi:hypothetical protein
MHSAPGVEVERVEVERAAVYASLLGLDFTARWPPDLRATLRERAARYERATR